MFLMEYIPEAIREFQKVFELAHSVSFQILKYRKQLITSLKKLDKILSKFCDDSQARHFYIQEVPNLKSLHSLLILLAEDRPSLYFRAINTIQTQYTSNADYMDSSDFKKELNPLIRAIFRTNLKDEWNLTPISPTPIFEAFVRGITHFENQNIIDTRFPLPEP